MTTGRRLLLVACAALAVALTLGARELGLLDRAQLASIDARFSIRGPEEPRSDLAVVAIDAETFDEIRQRYPFPRSFQARVIEKLTRAGARVVAYDIAFSEPSTRKEDQALLEAIDRSPQLVLASTRFTRPGEPALFAGTKRIEKHGARIGAAVIRPDEDGKFRRVHSEFDGVRSFAPLAADRARGKPTSLAEDPFWIDYAGPNRTIKHYSFADVLAGRFSNVAFADKVVVVGLTDPEQQDIHPIPFSEELMSGAEINANAIATALDDLPLRSPPNWIELAILILFCATIPLLALRLSGTAILLIALAIGASYVVAVQLAFDRGTILSLPYPILGLSLGTAGAFAVDLTALTREKRRTRELFSRFVPPDALDELIAGTAEIEAGGRELEATVLFCDLRGFTAFSRSLPAATIRDLLTQYLTAMTEAIETQGGTVIAYMGDGIMAVFGAPAERDDHADRAFAATREIAGPRLTRFNDWLQNQGLEYSFEIGIGVASGQVMWGPVGSTSRIGYSAVGAPTNLAAKLEQATKGAEYSVLIAASTVERLTNRLGLVEAKELGPSLGPAVWTLEAA